ncbi:hypothetical protein [Cryptosporangium aurantiacum]|uniref:hypothetical protein n=1 Tax=Cryptosporangium aurantiacum TaxID=134849 RepID=UPI000932772F|nr:hypothetical protein [Cryptosporangium aurantiacum]
MADQCPDDLRAASLGALLAEEAQLAHRVTVARASDFGEPLTAGTYLRLLEVRAAIVRTCTWGSQADVRDAVEAGATWEEIADARSVTPIRARADFLHWVEAQAALWDNGAVAGGARLGLSPRHRRAVRALAGYLF